MTYAEKSEVDLLNELQEAQMERVDELERRLIALESRLSIGQTGIASEARYGPGKLLAAEGELVEPSDETELTAEETAGIPLAAGFAPGRRPAVLTGDGYDLFDRRTTSGQSATAELGDLLAEVWTRREVPDDAPAARTGDDGLPLAAYRGVPVARGF